MYLVAIGKIGSRYGQSEKTNVNVGKQIMREANTESCFGRS